MGKLSNSADEDALESWITDLAGGETTVRRLRKRLDAERHPVEDACPTCSGASTGQPGHVPAIRTA
jgi:hypothetical protein